jgi:hypothetical protein
MHGKRQQLVEVPASRIPKKAEKRSLDNPFNVVVAHYRPTGHIEGFHHFSVVDRSVLQSTAILFFVKKNF